MRALLLAPLVAVLLTACDGPAAPTASEAHRDVDPVTYVTKEDTEVNAAIVEARRTLPTFWSLIARRPAGVSGYVVKLGMATPTGGREYLWIRDVVRRGDRVSGILENYPELIPDLKYGQTVDVDASLVADWAYLKDGKRFGDFTTRALLPHMDGKEAAAQRLELSSTPLEATGQP